MSKSKILTLSVLSVLCSVQSTKLATIVMQIEVIDCLCFFLNPIPRGLKNIRYYVGGADSARKEETRNSGCILMLREWGCHVISHLGVPE